MYMQSSHAGHYMYYIFFLAKNAYLGAKPRHPPYRRRDPTFPTFKALGYISNARFNRQVTLSADNNSESPLPPHRQLRRNRSGP